MVVPRSREAADLPVNILVGEAAVKNNHGVACGCKRTANLENKHRVGIALIVGRQCPRQLS